MRGFHTINQLIDEALVMFGDFERRNYQEAAMYFLQGYRDFELYSATGNLKTAWRSITPINTVNYPQDALRIVRVGINLNGELFPFTANDKLIEPITDPIDLALDTDRGEDDTLDRTPSWGYGMQGQNVEYYYKDEKDKRRIILSRMALDLTLYPNKSEVYIEYISNGIEDYNASYISDDAANLLIAFVVWMLVAARPDKYSIGYIQMKENEYIRRYKMYDFLQLPNLEDLENVIYETSSQSVRR